MRKLMVAIALLGLTIPAPLLAETWVKIRDSKYEVDITSIEKIGWFSGIRRASYRFQFMPYNKTTLEWHIEYQEFDCSENTYKRPGQSFDPRYTRPNSPERRLVRFVCDY